MVYLFYDDFLLQVQQNFKYFFVNKHRLASFINKSLEIKVNYSLIQVYLQFFFTVDLSFSQLIGVFQQF